MVYRCVLVIRTSEPSREAPFSSQKRRERVDGAASQSATPAMLSTVVISAHCDLDGEKTRYLKLPPDSSFAFAKGILPREILVLSITRIEFSKSGHLVGDCTQLFALVAMGIASLALCVKSGHAARPGDMLKLSLV